MKMCNICGGAIFATNEVVGYGGPICLIHNTISQISDNTIVKPSSKNPSPSKGLKAFINSVDAQSDNDLSEILNKFKDYLLEQNEIPGFIYQSERHLTQNEAKAKLEKLLADRENRARIDELNLVLHSGDSANSPRWTHENVKDRIKALSSTKSDEALALDKPSVRTEDNNQERSL